MIFWIILVLVIVCFFWFDFLFYKKNGRKFKEAFLEAEKNADLIIIFNSGGWGVVSYEKSNDLTPIIKEIKKSFKGKKIKIVPYYRTENHFIGKVAYLKDYFSFFSKESKQLANILKDSNSRVVLIGLSNGAFLADRVMDRLKDKENITSIEFGKPFFGGRSKNENILLLNDESDALSQGNVFKLLITFILFPINWIRNVFFKQEFALGLALKIDGHIYLWKDYNKEIIDFLKKKYEL